jgi:flagellar biosynthesis protein FlhB
MADEDREGKTEEPTPKRLAKAAEDGNVAKSAELTAAAVLLTGIFMGAQHAPAVLSGLQASMEEGLARISSDDLTPALAGAVLSSAVRDVFDASAPIVLFAAAAAFITTVAQIGVRFYPKRIMPSFDKLNPANGLKRIFSRRGFMELVKSVAKIALVAWISWKVLGGAVYQLPGLAFAAPRDILMLGGQSLADIMLAAGGVLGAIALIDFLWQWREHRQGLRMSKQEVKDENREQEGDPQVKGRVRKAYRQFSGNKMLAAVRTADVVVTNPVHVAVALKYSADEMGAPTVVAKGAEVMCERIKQAARQAGVPIVERRALARALFRSVPVGREIPGAMFRAVAEVLAYIYALPNRRAS